MILPSLELASLPCDFRVLVTGVTSIHGWPIYQALKQCLPPDRLYGVRPPKATDPSGEHVAGFCITDRQQLEKIRVHFQPTHVVHCAGVCDLDVCEERPAWAQRMNVEGTGVIRDVFGDKLPILYISTDLVFSGETTPKGGYAENHQTDPVSVAGRTFAEAETCLDLNYHTIVRLALPLGDSIHGDKGAIDWIEGRFKRSLPVTLFYDEYRSCIACEMIGRVVMQMLAQGSRGLYHLGGKRRWSLYEIGEYVQQRGSYAPELLKGRYREEEIGGPPRIGDVSLNSEKLKAEFQGWH